MRPKRKVRTGVLAGAAALLVFAAPLHARALSYGGIGATVAAFSAARPSGAERPRSQSVYYQIDNVRSGRVSNYHVVVNGRQRSGQELLTLMTAHGLPTDARMVKAYNGSCAIYQSRWLGHVLYGPYVVVYASSRTPDAYAMVSTADACRG